jgi:hypothetical protein
MPITSAKQFRLMQAAAHGGLKKDGPSAAVAKKFLAETPMAKLAAYAHAKPKKKKG